MGHNDSEQMKHAFRAEDLPLQGVADRVGIGAVDDSSVALLTSGPGDISVKFATAQRGQQRTYVLTVREPSNPRRDVHQLGAGAKFSRLAAEAGVPIAAAMPDRRTGALVHALNIRGEEQMGTVRNFVNGTPLGELASVDGDLAPVIGTALGTLHDYVTRATDPRYVRGWAAFESQPDLPENVALADRRLISLFQEVSSAMKEVSLDNRSMPLHLLPTDLSGKTIIGESGAHFVETGEIDYRHVGTEAVQFLLDHARSLEDADKRDVMMGFIDAYAEAGGDVTELQRSLPLLQVRDMGIRWENVINHPEPGAEWYEQALEQMADWTDTQRVLDPDLLTLGEVATVERVPVPDFWARERAGRALERGVEASDLGWGSELSSELVPSAVMEGEEAEFVPDVGDDETLSFAAHRAARRSADLDVDAEAAAPSREEVAKVIDISTAPSRRGPGLHL